MNKHVLALSTALSILAFTPAFAQTTPAVDCTQQANKSDPACMNQQNNNTNATQTQTQGQGGTSTTDQNAAQSGSSTTTTTDQNAQSTQPATTTTDQNAQTTTTTTQQTTTQASTGELIVPADRLNGAQMMSANDYIGKTVYDQAGNNIGDVNDLIISQDGQIQAVILGVGGFLGIGEKDVAVNTSAIKMVQDGDNTRLVVETTKEALNNAPTYDKKNRRYATDTNSTTTESTGSTTQPAPAPAPSDTTTGNTSGSSTVDCTQPANASDPACANKTQTQQ